MAKSSAKITTAKACDLAGITPGTLRVWRQRARAAVEKGDARAGILNSEFFQPEGGEFDYSGALFLAIVGELLGAGLSIWDAAECAFRVTEFSTFESGESFSLSDDEGRIREPGSLFAVGSTVLAVAPLSDRERYEAKVLNLVASKENPDDAFATQLTCFAGASSTVILVDIDRVDARIAAAFREAAA